MAVRGAGRRVVAVPRSVSRSVKQQIADDVRARILDGSPRPDDLTQDVFLTSDFGIAGREPSQTIEVSIVHPPQLVAERLALEPDGLAVVRRRVRFLDGEPFYSNDSYFPMAVAEGTAVMSPADIARGANQELARIRARPGAGGRRDFRPDADAARGPTA